MAGSAAADVRPESTQRYPLNAHTKLNFIQVIFVESLRLTSVGPETKRF